MLRKFERLTNNSRCSVFQFSAWSRFLKSKTSQWTFAGTLWSIFYLITTEMVELCGIEPQTSCVQSRRSPSWAIAPYSTVRTSYRWFFLRQGGEWRSILKVCESFHNAVFRENLVGLSGLEPPTSPLSGVRSNHLSYKPVEVLLLIFIRQSVWALQSTLL